MLIRCGEPTLLSAVNEVQEEMEILEALSRATNKNKANRASWLKFTASLEAFAYNVEKKMKSG